MKSIAFFGDPHFGSRHGLWPVSWLPNDSPYSGVRYLGQCFDHLVASWPDVDVLILMGDLIEGKAQKSQATGVFTANVGEQVKGAIEGLRPLAAKAKRILRVTGTPYHDQFDDPLATLDLALGVERVQQVFNISLPTPDGRPSVLNVAHHPPGGGVLYEATKLNRQILWNIIASTTRKIPAARWIVRAHLHSFSVLRLKGITAAINPCMKLADGYAVKGNYEGWQPDLGGMLLVRDDTDVTGWRFRETIYENPQEELLELVER